MAAPLMLLTLFFMLAPAIIPTRAQQSSPPISSKTSASVGFSVTDITVDDVRSLIGNGTKSCKDVIQAHLNRIKEYNSKINAIITVNSKAADEAAAKDKSGSVVTGKLHCVPLLVQDNIDVAGMATTNGAEAFRIMAPSDDSVAVKKLRDAGAIVIGKTNMAELGIGRLNTNSKTGGQCKNPYDLDRTCYGSSGGSASALAASLGVIALAADSDGSIFGPCHGNGVFCFRNYFGWTSTAGVYPTFSKTEVMVPMARTVKDVLIVWTVLHRRNLDVTNYMKTDGMKNVRVGVMMNMFQKFSLPNTVVNYVAAPSITGTVFSALAEMKSKEAAIEVIQLSSVNSYITDIKVIKNNINVCSKSCLVKDLDAYFARFTGVKPYNSSKNLLTSTRGTAKKLISSYETTLNESINARTGLPGNVCNDLASTTCKPFIDKQIILQRQVSSLMNNSGAPVDLLVVPIYNKPAIPLTDINTSLGMNPDEISLVFSPYVGWPSVALPVGFSPAVTGSTDGIPIGLNILCQNNTAAIDKMIKFVYAYQQHFPKWKVPSSAPQLYNATKNSPSLQHCSFILLVTTIFISLAVHS